jgi:hypothetical protein
MDMAMRVDNDETIPPLSPGAATLLAIAQENDKHNKIADNAALRLALQDLERLAALCAAQDESGLMALLRIKDLSASWFTVCVSLVKSIESRMEELSRHPSEGWSVRTDFDRNVFLAIGQSIGAIVRENCPEKKALDYPAQELIQSLSQLQPFRLQQLLIENYIGNILQELFDTCKIRLNVRGLPKDTEARLRKTDAHALAELLFLEQAQAGPGIDLKRLLAALRGKLAKIREEASMMETEND